MDKSFASSPVTLLTPVDLSLLVSLSALVSLSLLVSLSALVVVSFAITGLIALKAGLLVSVPTQNATPVIRAGFWALPRTPSGN